jgi:glutaredoxin 3
MAAKVLVYTAQNCPYCVRAKELLKRKAAPFEEILVSWEDEAAWAALEKRSGMKTVPQIFINDRCIGGFTDMAALDQKGELDKLLRG